MLRPTSKRARKPSTRRASRHAGPSRVFDARPDSLDFRDLMYTPTLVEVPRRLELSTYAKVGVPILDQGAEGACTGFGLATVANFLLRKRGDHPKEKSVSPRMLYELARRYDEWQGEDYSGSSARGAMKGWHRHGVCAETTWPYKPEMPDSTVDDKRARDAAKRPLGAYLRVNHKDLVAMHASLAEVGILYATASVHDGWDAVKADGEIPFRQVVRGGHAFAIVAYEDRGFWIQNSWGTSWGKKGFGLLSYDDWLQNGTDVWVARLGVPLTLTTSKAQAAAQSAMSGQSSTYAYRDLRPHIVSIGNDGALRTGGTFGTSEDDVREIFETDFSRITAKWKKKRLLLYAHGGLVAEEGAIQRLADYRSPMLANEIYPISFIWKSDFWTTLKNLLEDAQRRRRPEGFLDATKDFMLDRADDALEVLVRRVLRGNAIWNEMKENATRATTESNGGARFSAEFIAGLAEKGVELHIIGHSAGSIFHAPLVDFLTKTKKLKIASCTLWAPACTMELFRKYFAPAITDGSIERFAVYTLTDCAEQDDHCAHLYNKSLLYLVSNALEKTVRIPLVRKHGEPLLGMAKFIETEQACHPALWKKVAHVIAPNSEPPGSDKRSTSTEHGGFDDDTPTLVSTLERILKATPSDERVTFMRSASSLIARRTALS